MATPYFANVDISTWTYQEPTRNANGGTSVYMTDSRTGRNPRVQLPKCRVPFGLQDGKSENGEPKQTTRKNLELDVGDEALRRWAASLDVKNAQFVVDNSQQMFKKEMKLATVEALQRPLAPPPSKPQFNPLMRLKVNTAGRAPTRVMVVEEEGTADSPLQWRTGSFTDLTAGCHVVPIVEVSGLWFVSKGFGMTLTATDLLVYPSEDTVEFPFGLGGAPAAVRVERSSRVNDPEPDPSVFGHSVARSTAPAAAPSVASSAHGAASSAHADDAAMDEIPE